MLIRNGDGWSPNDLLSPSRISKAGECRIAEVLRYLHGLKPEDNNIEIGKVLGSASHEQLEGYVEHGVDFCEDYDYSDDLIKRLEQMPYEEADVVISRAPLSAKSALASLPPLSKGTVHCETQLEIDSRLWFPPEYEMTERLPFNDMCAIDLIWIPDDPTQPVEVIDYKTTVGARRNGKTHDRWAYVPTLKDLIEDCQFVLELASVWQQLHVTGFWVDRPCQLIRGRWVYISTALDLAPASTSTRADVDCTSNDFVGRVCKWLKLGFHIVADTRDALAAGEPPDHERFELPQIIYPNRESPCQKYKGCAYHKTRGGPCYAGLAR